jgi:hypothetical protein
MCKVVTIDQPTIRRLKLPNKGDQHRHSQPISTAKSAASTSIVIMGADVRALHPPE